MSVESLDLRSEDRDYLRLLAITDPDTAGLLYNTGETPVVTPEVSAETREPIFYDQQFYDWQVEDPTLDD